MKNKLKYLLPVVLAALTFSCNTPKGKDETIVTADSATAPATVAPNKTADKNSLVGTWVRTDAPYEIKISALQDDGNLKAGYFNPKPINVSKAMWDDKDGVLKIYIELRDENYPGSYYKLNYSAEQDALTGEYFQAVESTTYIVAFTKAK